MFISVFFFLFEKRKNMFILLVFSKILFILGVDLETPNARVLRIWAR